MRKVLLVLVLSPLLVASRVGVNRSGICAWQLRRLSDEEKIRAAVSFVIAKGWLPHDHTPGEPRYENADQYMNWVPNCCEAGDFVGGLDFERNLGDLGGIVSIANVPRAKAEFASPEERTTLTRGLGDSGHYFIAVSNCGSAWDPTD